ESKPPMQTAPQGVGFGSESTEIEEVKPPTPEEKATALARLEKAITAHGGAERLRKLRTQIQKLKGKMHVPATQTMEQTDQQIQLLFPDKMRLDMKLFLAEGVQDFVVCING